MAIEGEPLTTLAPGETIPDDVQTSFLGAEGETLEATRPEDTWQDYDGSYPYDGLHIYETFVGHDGEPDETGKSQFVSERILTRPIITQKYADEVNAAAIATDSSSPFMKPDVDRAMSRMKEAHYGFLGSVGISTTEYPRRYEPGHFTTLGDNGAYLGYINRELVDVMLVENGVEDPRVLDPERFDYDSETRKVSLVR